MEHNILLEGATVYVWYLNRKGLMSERLGPIGHSAIKLSDGRGGYAYLSFWPADKPGDRPGAPGPKTRQHIAKQLDPEGGKDAVAVRIAKLLTAGIGHDQDPGHEGRKPDYRCRLLRGMDFAAMVKFAKDVNEHKMPAVPGQKAGEYSFTNQNCSHAVAYCLNAGNPPLAVPLKGTFTNLWHPTDVYKYCTKLVAKLNEQYGPGAALQTNDKRLWV